MKRWSITRVSVVPPYLVEQIRGAVAGVTFGSDRSIRGSLSSGVNNSPTIIKRELDSSLSLASGEVIVLGGLVTDQRSDNRAGLWFLPRFLDSTSNGGSRREIVLVLQVERIAVGYSADAPSKVAPR